MMNWKMGFAALAVSLVIPANGSDAEPVGAADGQALYMEFGCFGCHGTVGQGATTGTRLTPVLALPAFKAFLRRPPNLMPAYPEHLLSDAQVAEIHAYLATVPPPRDPESIPILSSE